MLAWPDPRPPFRDYNLLYQLLEKLQVDNAARLRYLIFGCLHIAYHRFLMPDGAIYCNSSGYYTLFKIFP
jgi:hypothetical protein